MGKHFLFKRAVLFDKKEKNSNLSKYRFDKKIGAWMSNKKDDFLINVQDCSGLFLGTKKMDMETGEDQKGE